MVDTRKTPYDDAVDAWASVVNLADTTPLEVNYHARACALREGYLSGLDDTLDVVIAARAYIISIQSKLQHARGSLQEIALEAALVALTQEGE